MILLVLAFLIYGLFSPSGASRLWYNVRTFPQRVMSWTSDQVFLNYDSYRLDISSIGSRDDSEFTNREEINENIKWSTDTLVSSDESSEKAKNKKDKETKKTENISKNVIWYSANDVVNIVSKYIKNNLDDDTDILVTIEYDDEDSVRKIVLKTQVIVNDAWHFVSLPRLSVKEFLDWIRSSKTSVVGVISWSDNASYDEDKKAEINKDITKKNSSSNNVVKNTEIKEYSWLTQVEIEEAEEIFSILF